MEEEMGKFLAKLGIVMTPLKLLLWTSFLAITVVFVVIPDLRGGLVFIFIAACFGIAKKIRQGKLASRLETIRLRFPDFALTHEYHAADKIAGVLLDAKRFVLGIYRTQGGRHVECFTYRDILKTEVVEDGGTVSSTNRTSQVVGAVVGGALLGGVGLLVGGLSGKKNSQTTVHKISVEITTKDVNNPLMSVTMLDSPKPLKRSSPDATTALKKAKELHAMLSIFVRKADDEDKQRAHSPQSTQTSPRQGSNMLDELDRLLRLKDQGELSPEEFLQVKTALLAKERKELTS